MGELSNLPNIGKTLEEQLFQVGINTDLELKRIGANVEKININNSDVTIEGNDNLYHKASWTYDGEAFSVCSDSGIEKEVMIDIAESVN